jgi:hypothetical protein
MNLEVRIFRDVEATENTPSDLAKGLAYMSQTNLQLVMQGAAIKTLKADNERLRKALENAYTSLYDLPRSKPSTLIANAVREAISAALKPNTQ